LSVKPKNTKRVVTSQSAAAVSDLGFNLTTVI